MRPAYPVVSRDTLRHLRAMAYDEGLAQRIREALDDVGGISEKKLFGGLAFLVRGNMCAGVVGEELMVRVGADAYADALSQPHAREMDFTGKSMKGLVHVGCAGIESDDELGHWLERGVAFAGSLPAK